LRFPEGIGVYNTPIIQEHPINQNAAILLSNFAFDFFVEANKMTLMGDLPDLSNKTVVITGASSGIGWQTALEFCKRDASVIGVGRDPQRCEQARLKLLAAYPAAKIQYLTADLSRQSEVRKLGDQIKDLLRQSSTCLNILVNNAGTFMDRLTLTEDDVETTIAVNHLAPFLLTNLLLPELQACPDSRVITVSSHSHYSTWINPAHLRRPLLFNSLWAYKVSKLCNVLFSVELNNRQQGRAPHAFAVDPGLVNTDIGLKGTGSLVSFAWRCRQKAGVDPAVPAATILFVAANPEVLNSNAVYWYLSAPKQPSRTALDSSLAHQLWDESCRLCNFQG
jgi:NAD(P)-dependent dehydrogenase (short-subunit alcohol dehydrogenase family)